MLTLRVFLGAVVSADWTEEQSCHSGRSAGKSGHPPGYSARFEWSSGAFHHSIVRDYRIVRRLVKRTTPGTSGRSPWLR